MSLSILDKKDRPVTDAPRDAYYQDLNLDQIIRWIDVQWSGRIKDFYRYFPADEECEKYRREVFSDIKKQEVSEALFAFFDRVLQMEEAQKQRELVRSAMQKQLWLLREIAVYCEAFEELYAKLKTVEAVHEGMQRFKEHLGEYLKDAQYLVMKARVDDVLKRFYALRFTITYDGDRIAIGECKEEYAYEAFLDSGAGKDRAPVAPPFLIDPTIGALESECLRILTQKEPKLFRSLTEFSQQYSDYGDEALLRFIKELPFYLSFLAFERDMQKKGFVFAAPTTDRGEKMFAEGLYDLALAVSAVRDGREVVSNDMYYGEDESFFVLTGPNQGGKTTFARSLGQLVFFTKMGLDVPAASANVHYFRNILTHFSVEESVETGRGKLKEELIRLAPMMADHQENMFVVINELFTTAATYDAEIMGKKVLGNFISRRCRGIYVTHLKELASAHEKVVSLRAMLNEERLQTFRIARSEAEESACAANQVNKYRLTYEQLKERLS